MRKHPLVLLATVPLTALTAGPARGTDAAAAAESMLWDGRIDDGLRVVDVALEGADDPRARAALLVEKGKLHAFEFFVAGRGYDEAIAALAEAERLAQDAGSETLLADALAHRGFALYAGTMTGGGTDYAPARGLFERSLDLRIRAGDVRGVAESRFYLGLVHERESQPDRARQEYQRSLAVAREHGLKLEESYALRHLGFLDQADGRLEGALDKLDHSLRLREEIGFRIYLPFSHLAVADILQAQGHGGRAMEHYGTARQLARDMHLDRAVVLCDLSIGDAFAAAGKAAEAREHFAAAAALSGKIGYSRGVELAKERLVEP